MKRHVCIADGGTIIFPTDTVYGIGCAAENDGAVESIFAAKRRPAEKPLAVHLASPDLVARFARRITPVVRALVETFWPGPLTIIVEREATACAKPQRAAARRSRFAVRTTKRVARSYRRRVRSQRHPRTSAERRRTTAATISARCPRRRSPSSQVGQNSGEKARCSIAPPIPCAWSDRARSKRPRSQKRSPASPHSRDELARPTVNIGVRMHLRRLAISESSSSPSTRLRG